MTFIAVRWPHCQSDQIVKRGKTARGTQRYLCQNTLCAKGSFLGFVANFAQELMKGQLPPSVGGLGGQRVELFGRSEALVSLLDH